MSKVDADKWREDCKRGREEAAALIARMRARRDPLLLRTKIAELGNPNTNGHANGFLTVIGEQLIGRR